MDRDSSRYDFYHVVFEPRGMTRDEIVAGMARARSGFYSRRSIARHVAANAPSLGFVSTLINLPINWSYRDNQRRGYEYPP